MDLSKIARDTRDLLLRMNPVISSVQTILSHDDNVHTTLDREIDTYLQHGLPGVLDAAIVSEERDLGSADLKDCFWLIDPVDGTINAISGSADWAISIALIETATMQPLVGVVYLPLHREMFVAASGSGAELNDTPLAISAPRRNAGGYSTPIVSFGVPADIAAVSEKMGITLASIMRQGWVTRQTGSAAVDICRVARGSWSAFFEYDLMYWDIAAAMLIANEAGCRVALPQPEAPIEVAALSKPCDVLVAASDPLVSELEKITNITGS